MDYLRRHIPGFAPHGRHRRPRLQANPNLSIDDILDVAARTAHLPSSGKGWGNGKVDAWEGIKTILAESSVFDIIESAPESILIDNLGSSYLISAPAQSSVSATVYDLSGRAIASASSNSDSVEISVATLPAGIYILKAQGSHSCRSIKLSVK